MINVLLNNIHINLIKQKVEYDLNILLIVLNYILTIIKFKCFLYRFKIRVI